MNKTLKCRDCGTPFTRSEFSLLTKCEHCLDRDQMYRERWIIKDKGLDQSIDSDIDYQEHNI